jgi:hypothetical protein
MTAIIASADIVDEPEQTLRLRSVHTGGRLVQHQQARARRQRPHQFSRRWSP